VLVRVALQPRVLRLVEDRQPDLGQVDQLDVEPAVGPGQLLHPLRHGQPLATGTGAAEDDLQDGLGHGAAPGAGQLRPQP
jgi:hypothetical protein